MAVWTNRCRNFGNVLGSNVALRSAGRIISSKPPRKQEKKADHRTMGTPLLGVRGSEKSGWHTDTCQPHAKPSNIAMVFLFLYEKICGLSVWISELIKDHSLIKTSLNDLNNIAYVSIVIITYRALFLYK